MVQVLDLWKISLTKDLLSHQVEAMIDHSCTEEVVTTLMTCINSVKKEHHIIEELSSCMPVTHCVDTFDDDVIDDLRGKSIDQRNPSVDQRSLLSKLDINCFSHLNASDKVM